MSIVVGFEKDTGNQIDIFPGHFFVAGTTGSGKSLLLRSLLARATKIGFRIICIDMKDPPDFSPFFPKVKPYIDHQSDPLVIKRLLESTKNIWLKQELPDLIRICKVKHSWEGVYDEMTRLIDEDDAYMKWADKGKHGKNPSSLRRPLSTRTRNSYEIIAELLRELIEEMKSVDLANKVELLHPTQVVNLTGYGDALQQVVVKSISKYIMENETNVILLIDEFQRVAQAGISSAAKPQIEKHIREGRAKGNFLWASSQTVTETAYGVRKQMMVWFLARQVDVNEAERVIKQTIGAKKLGLTFRDAFEMETGFFLMSDFNHQLSRILYAWPDGVTREAAIEVARGRLEVERVAAKIDEKIAQKNPILVGEDEEKMWKEKWDELNATLRKERQDRTEENAKHSQQIIELQTKVSRLAAALEEATKATLVKPDIAPFVTAPGELEEIAPDVIVNADDIMIQVNHRPLPREFDTGNVKGQIMYIFSEQPSRQMKLSTGQIKGLAEEYGWNSDLSTWSKRTGELVKEGSLVQEGEGNASLYRIPLKVEFHAKLLPPLEKEVVA